MTSIPDNVKAELRDAAAQLVEWGYRKDEARRIVWMEYRGGIDAVRTVRDLLGSVVTIADEDIEF